MLPSWALNGGGWRADEQEGWYMFQCIRPSQPLTYLTALPMRVFSHRCNWWSLHPGQLRYRTCSLPEALERRQGTLRLQLLRPTCWAMMHSLQFGSSYRAREGLTWLLAAKSPLAAVLPLIHSSLLYVTGASSPRSRPLLWFPPTSIPVPPLTKCLGLVPQFPTFKCTTGFSSPNASSDFCEIYAGFLDTPCHPENFCRTWVCCLCCRGEVSSAYFHQNCGISCKNYLFLSLSGSNVHSSHSPSSFIPCWFFIIAGNLRHLPIQEGNWDTECDSPKPLSVS